MTPSDLQKYLSAILASSTIKEKDSKLLRLKAQIEREEIMTPYRVSHEE